MPTSSESSTASCTTKRDDNGEYDHCRDEKNKGWRRQENEDKINEILEFSKMRCRLQSTA